MGKYLLFILPIVTFLFGFLKKSSNEKVKEAANQQEINSLKKSIVMEKAKEEGVRNEKELYKRLMKGNF